jgi:hypothetical protein
MYEIEIQYDTVQHRAEFDCPLCNNHWVFPFPVRPILDVPQPTPNLIVALHLYGCGPGGVPCAGFDLEKVPHLSTQGRTQAKLNLY